MEKEYERKSWGRVKERERDYANIMSSSRSVFCYDLLILSSLIFFKKIERIDRNRRIVQDMIQAWLSFWGLAELKTAVNQESLLVGLMKEKERASAHIWRAIRWTADD